jgi:hypothetical protein
MTSISNPLLWLSPILIFFGIIISVIGGFLLLFIFYPLKYSSFSIQSKHRKAIGAVLVVLGSFMLSVCLIFTKVILHLLE